MNRWTLLIVLALTLVQAASANADPPRPYEERLHIDTPCPGTGGTCAISPDIYLEPGAIPFMLWHERGHLFDAQVLTDDQREWFTKQLGRPGDAWDEGTDWGLNAKPSELFADAYAACQLRLGRAVREGRMTTRRWITAYGYFLKPRAHRRVCNAIGVATLLADPAGL